MTDVPYFVRFLMARLKEPSTWRGVISIVTAMGVALSPSQMEAIIAGGLALMGIVGAFTPDAKSSG